MTDEIFPQHTGKSYALVELMPEFRSLEFGIFAMYPTRKHVAPKVRALIDFLARQFAETPLV